MFLQVLWTDRAGWAPAVPNDIWWPTCTRLSHSTILHWAVSYQNVIDWQPLVLFFSVRLTLPYAPQIYPSGPWITCFLLPPGNPLLVKVNSICNKWTNWVTVTQSFSPIMSAFFHKAPIFHHTWTPFSGNLPSKPGRKHTASKKLSFKKQITWIAHSHFFFFTYTPHPWSSPTSFK